MSGTESILRWPAPGLGCDLKKAKKKQIRLEISRKIDTLIKDDYSRLIFNIFGWFVMLMRLTFAAGLLPLMLFQLLSGSGVSCFAAGKSIRFSPLPMLSAEAVTDNFSPFATYLSDVTDSSIELVYYQDFQVLIEGFANDQLDLAYLGPLPYVLLKQRMPDVIPLARFVDAEGKATYTCSLVSFSEKIDMQEVSFATPIAMPQPYSTCAYLMTENFLRQQGGSLERLPYYYAGNHAEAALDVVRGKASFAGVKTQIGEMYEKLGLHVFEQNVPLPGFLLVANPHTLSAEQIALLKSKILELDPLHNAAAKRLTSVWGREIRYGAIPVEKEDYRYIGQVLTDIKIPGVSE